MALVIDPVCGMEFPKSVALANSEYLNRTFYFCHPACKQIFDIVPTRFVYTPKELKPARRCDPNRRKSGKAVEVAQ